MDDSYSSSFDSDDSSEQNYPLESPKIPVRLPQTSSAASMRVKSKQAQQERFDPQLLNDAVRELQRLNHERLATRVPSGRPLRPVRNRTFTESQVQHIDQVNGVLVRKILEQQMRPVRFSADASKRTPNLPSSATINRRRKQQQIDSDNLKLLKKLQTVKPSSEITAWKKDVQGPSSSSSCRPSVPSTRASSRNRTLSEAMSCRSESRTF